MNSRIIIAATLALALGACSGGGETKDGVSAQDRSDLDNAAAMVETNQTFDTSADSLVLNDSAADAAIGNAPAPAAPGNGSATMNSSAIGNASGPR